MDTRSKIISAELATKIAPGGNLLVVRGSFDVLLARHALDLQKVKEGTPGAILLIVLTPASVPLLSEQARAEMVAALHMVDYVVIGAPDDLLCRIQAARVISRQAEDNEQTRLLMQHVHRRNNR